MIKHPLNHIKTEWLITFTAYKYWATILDFYCRIKSTVLRRRCGGKACTCGTSIISYFIQKKEDTAESYMEYLENPNVIKYTL
jgi:hypothetical protein